METVQPDVIIVGAGIIGATSAWRLAQQGFRVTLVDAGKLGGEASSAGAGMLAPGGEIVSREGWAGLALESLEAYLPFVAELELASGLSIDYRRCGAMELAKGEVEWRELTSRAALQREIGITSAPLTRDEAAERLPGVCLDGVTGVMWYPDDAIVEPRHVMEALRMVLANLPVELRENSAVRAVQCHTGGVEVCLESGVLRGRSALIAAGAWSGQLDIAENGRHVPVPRSLPIRGHLVAHHLSSGTLGPILRYQHTYLLQRANGRLLAGTTEEEAGFDRAVDPVAVADIGRRAGELVPVLAGREPEEAWIGFRPATGSRKPEIGRVGTTRVWLAYGHYRNGILLAPATARLVSAGIAAEIA